MGRLRVRRTEQPQQPIGLDTGHPSIRGLEFNFSGSTPLFDNVTKNRPLTYSTRVSQGNTLAGRSARIIDTGGGGSNIIFPTPVVSRISGATETTSQIVFRLNNTANTFHAFGSWNTTEGNFFLIQISGIGLVWIPAENNAAARTRWDATSLFTQGKIHNLVLVWKGGAVAKMFLDGVDRTAALSIVSSAATSIRTSAAIARLHLGPIVAGQAHDVDFIAANAWVDALPDADAKALSSNSWSLYTPNRRTIYTPLSTGVVTHPTSGSLTGSAATVAGTAAHIAKHASTGVLSGQAGSVVGGAARKRAMASSGVLSGTGAAIVGAAARSATGVHTTTGALVGATSLVVGSATRKAVHTTTAVLTGVASVVVGVAKVQKIHSSTGVLVSVASIIVGAASKALILSSTPARHIAYVEPLNNAIDVPILYNSFDVEP